MVWNNGDAFWSNLRAAKALYLWILNLNPNGSEDESSLRTQTQTETEVCTEHRMFTLDRMRGFLLPVRFFSLPVAVF